MSRVLKAIIFQVLISATDVPAQLVGRLEPTAPLFEKNVGQYKPEVVFAARTRGSVR